jgi:hypothetical protein
VESVESTETALMNMNIFRGLYKKKNITENMREFKRVDGQKITFGKF